MQQQNISLTKQIKTGFAAYIKAFRLIRANKLTKYLLIPAILNIIVVVAFIFSGVGISDWINGIIERSTENMNGWIHAGMVAIKIILPIVFFALFIFIGGTIVNILMSPIYTFLSEKTETILTGKEFPFDMKQTVLCLLLNFIPVAGSVASLVLIFIINAYYFGFGFMDYTYERWRMSPKDSRNETHKLKFVAFANGAVYSLPLYLICGSFIAAFIGGVSTVAATLSQLEFKEK